jgi:hypothetical protein
MPHHPLGPTAPTPVAPHLPLARLLTAIFVWTTFIGGGLLVSSLTGGPLQLDDWGLSGWLFYAIAFVPTLLALRRLTRTATSPQIVVGWAIAIALLLIASAIGFALLMAYLVSRPYARQ